MHTIIVFLLICLFCSGCTPQVFEEQVNTNSTQICLLERTQTKFFREESDLRTLQLGSIVAETDNFNVTFDRVLSDKFQFIVHLTNEELAIGSAVLTVDWYNNQSKLVTTESILLWTSPACASCYVQLSKQPYCLCKFTIQKDSTAAAQGDTLCTLGKNTNLLELDTDLFIQFETDLFGCNVVKLQCKGLEGCGFLIGIVRNNTITNVTEVMCDTPIEVNTYYYPDSFVILDLLKGGT